MEGGGIGYISRVGISLSRCFVILAKAGLNGPKMELKRKTQSNMELRRADQPRLLRSKSCHLGWSPGVPHPQGAQASWGAPSAGQLR